MAYLLLCRMPLEDLPRQTYLSSDKHKPQTDSLANDSEGSFFPWKVKTLSAIGEESSSQPREDRCGELSVELG